MARRAPKRSGNTLYVGIDLGTSRSAISASNGRRQWTESYVGYPKDFVSQRALGESVLFGADALDNRLSLEVHRPLEHGVIREGTARDEEAVMDLVGHLVELVEPSAAQRIHAAVGVPSEALKVNKVALKDAVAEYAHALMIVSEPFAVAYGQGLLNDSIVIDIGAGTSDLCVMHGTMPADDEQKTILQAGDYIDRQLLELLKEKYPKSSFTLDTVRQLKEQAAFVGDTDEVIEVDIPVEGKLVTHDITEEMRRACEGIMPAVVETTVDLIAKFDPEYQERLRNNIIVAGGGSQIEGLTDYLETAFNEYGPSSVKTVEDPLFAGADGALQLAQDMPEEYWEEM